MGIVWGNTTPSTELPRDFCAGIGPLQLGVVLVIGNRLFNVQTIGEIRIENKQAQRRAAAETAAGKIIVFFTRFIIFQWIIIVTLTNQRIRIFMLILKNISH